MGKSSIKPFVAIACGGTGGHLFPGLAVGEELLRRGCEITLLISPKEVDQQAVKSATGMTVATLPAFGLTSGQRMEFLRGCWKSLVAAKKHFHSRPPQAVLAMGGFTSAPPVLAGKACGAVTFLHESNAIPGRANRWLAHVVDQAFVGFTTAAGRLHHQNVLVTGTPVRAEFQPADAASCRTALGLHPQRPVLLVMGGSQGASGINELVAQSLPLLVRRMPELQFLHLTGASDAEKVQTAYQQLNCKAIVRPFLTEMDFALGAATATVSRSGASSLAELAAMRLPAILIPYPAAADNHQYYNARAFVDTGAALLVEQLGATPHGLADSILKLVTDSAARAAASEALARWHTPHAAELIAERILALVQARSPGRWEGRDDASVAQTALRLRDNPQSAIA